LGFFLFKLLGFRKTRVVPVEDGVHLVLGNLLQIQIGEGVLDDLPYLILPLLSGQPTNVEVTRHGMGMHQHYVREGVVLTHPADETVHDRNGGLQPVHLDDDPIRFQEQAVPIRILTERVHGPNYLQTPLDPLLLLEFVVVLLHRYETHHGRAVRDAFHDQDQGQRHHSRVYAYLHPFLPFSF
jgi:hypothetical protein